VKIMNDLIREIASYTLIYIAVTALSLPGAAVMTLAGGGLFGLLVGTIVVSFRSWLKKGKNFHVTISVFL
jgi:uncharacterized membrane protein YdjX (TVP38/TMEM64 family)